MDEDPLRCDGCSRESWPDGSLVLLLREEETIKTVRYVRVACGPVCASTELADPNEHAAVVFSFRTIEDVFDYADRMIAAHDWERGTVQRLSRVLAALHRRRAPITPP
jgi:hypothetical protein